MHHSPSNALMCSSPAAREAAKKVDADKLRISSYYVHTLLDMPLGDIVRSWRKARLELRNR